MGPGSSLNEKTRAKKSYASVHLAAVLPGSLHYSFQEATARRY
jgi:hypothetical protein